MRINVRTTKGQATAVDLFKDLLKLPGDQLLITTGYLTDPRQLPSAAIVASVASVVLAVGHWPPGPNGGGVTKAEVRQAAGRFAWHLQQAALRSGVKAPPVRIFSGPCWHAKIAIKRDSVSKAISGAVIGSSNVSNRAMGLSAAISNSEVDILVTSQDGPTAPAQLAQLYRSVADSLEGFIEAKF